MRYCVIEIVNRDANFPAIVTFHVLIDGGEVANTFAAGKTRIPTNNTIASILTICCFISLYLRPNAKPKNINRNEKRTMAA